MTKIAPLEVILGSQTIKAYVASPKEFNVIGIVRMGMEFGLLATTKTGRYVRVNGSQVQALGTARVEAAIQLAKITGRGAPYSRGRETSHAYIEASQSEKTAASNDEVAAHPGVAQAIPAVVYKKRRSWTTAISGRTQTPIKEQIAA